MENKIVKKILKRVEAILGFLPEKGVIAGQSIATLYLEEIGFQKKMKRDIKINDIDLFVHDANISITNWDLDSREPGITKKNVKNKIVGEYNNILHNGVQIFKKSERDGMLNTIYYNASDASAFVFVSYQRIIESFDINAVQVGISMEDKKLIKTKEFEKFLNSGQMEMTEFGSPFDTLNRMYKKREEQGYYFNEKLEKEKCNIFYSIYNRKYIGEVIYNRWKHRANELGFVLTEIFLNNTVNDLSLSYSDFKQKYRLFTVDPIDKSSAKIYNKIFIGRDSDVIKLCAELIAFKKDKTLARMESMFKKKRKNSLYENDGYLVRYLTEDENIIGVKKFLFQKHFREAGWNYEENKMSFLAKIISEHPEYTYHFSNFNYRNSIILAEILIEVTREDLGGLGYLRNYINGNNIYETGFVDKDRTIFEIKRELEQEEGALRAQILKEKFIEDFEEDGYSFRELVTGFDLVQEGRLMKHCVGGYKSKVESLRSIIYAVRYKDEKMTLEISRNKVACETSETYDMKVVQLRLPCNIDASEEHYNNVEEILFPKLRPLIQNCTVLNNKNGIESKINPDDIPF